MKLSIQVLVDNPNSWLVPYAKKLVDLLSKSHECFFIQHEKEITKGDILILLACEKKISQSLLSLHTNNFVVHESDLPKGKGWSPLTWQILEGHPEIVISLFEAADKIDAGNIYSKKRMKFKGDELLDELRDIQGNATIDIVMDVIQKYPNSKGAEQLGESTYYPKRTSLNSELDMNKSIDEQFNLLRVVDNDRYPAFFIKNGIKYILKINKAK